MTALVRKLLLLALLLICTTKVAESFNVNILSSLQQLNEEIRVQNEMEKCAIGAIDMVICLDASGSIQDKDFATAKLFIANLTRFLNIGISDTQSRVGLILFRQYGVPIFQLDTYFSNTAVFNAIVNANRPDIADQTNIASCMNEAVDLEFGASSGARANVPHILILLTDGQDSSDVIGAHANAVNKHVVTYAIGVGPDVNYNQLVNATGDSSKVFQTGSFDALQNILNDLCGDIASSVEPTTTTYIPPTSGGASGGTNAVRACSTSSPNKIALDIIFALDASQAVGEDNYATFKTHIAGVIRLLTVNQGATRIGLIYYADKAYVVANLTTYTSAADAAQSIQAMPYTNKIALDIRTDTIGPEQEEACRIAASLKQAEVTIMTILLKLAPGQYPSISLATPCYIFSNDAQLTRNLVFGWYDVSCYCSDAHYTQFVNPSNKCEKYAECVLLQLTPDTWENARQTCLGQGGAFLADEFSNAKNLFLRNLLINSLPNGENPYFWNGLNDRAQQGTYMWDHGSAPAVPQQSSDFKFWGQNQPNDANGNCIAQSNRVGFNLYWASKKCNDPLDPNANLFFFCQQNACTGRG